MRIIIDSNILFSALIKDAFIRKLILKYTGHFLFPEYIFEELNKHREELFQKSKMGEEDFYKLLKIILRKVKVIPNSTLLPHRSEALEIVKEIDPNDVLFIACALAHPNSIIWSEDKALKKQNKVRVLNTTAIISLI